MPIWSSASLSVAVSRWRRALEIGSFMDPSVKTVLDATAVRRRVARFAGGVRNAVGHAQADTSARGPAP